MVNFCDNRRCGNHAKNGPRCRCHEQGLTLDKNGMCTHINTTDGERMRTKEEIQNMLADIRSEAGDNPTDVTFALIGVLIWVIGETGEK